MKASKRARAQRAYRKAKHKLTGQFDSEKEESVYFLAILVGTLIYFGISGVVR